MFFNDQDYRNLFLTVSELRKYCALMPSRKIYWRTSFIQTGKLWQKDIVFHIFSCRAKVGCGYVNNCININMYVT